MYCLHSGRIIKDKTSTLHWHSNNSNLRTKKNHDRLSWFPPRKIKPSSRFKLCKAFYCPIAVILNSLNSKQTNTECQVTVKQTQSPRTQIFTTRLRSVNNWLRRKDTKQKKRFLFHIHSHVFKPDNQIDYCNCSGFKLWNSIKEAPGYLLVRIHKILYLSGTFCIFTERLNHHFWRWIETHSTKCYRSELIQIRIELTRNLKKNTFSLAVPLYQEE